MAQDEAVQPQLAARKEANPDDKVKQSRR